MNPDRSTLSLETELAESSHPVLSPGEIVLGSLIALDAQGRPLVNFPQCVNANGLPAVTTLAISQADVGRQVALLFANGDFAQPIIIGLIYSPLYQLLDNFMLSDGVPAQTSLQNGDQQVFEGVSLLPVNQQPVSASATENIRVDGKKVIIEGEEEVVLSCGESSITLNRNGKIVIRGKYLLSRASGVNRILGGSVEVN